ncbi:MAG: isocitrate/isopropylmalate dehydrogenase family protein [marine benthic group bacterium]|jgi:3-isopropylmalate dehydrogenase|nr:isocitrate/isopropylmalate dehydrogenase family protein [Candidatus Benthicola marisminoris]
MIRVALIPGDGVGPEVVREAERVLVACETAGLARIQTTAFPHGADHYLTTGETLSDETFAALRDGFDGILLGAVGDSRVPDGRHARDILLGLRFRLDLFINFRPARLRLPELSPLRCADGRPIDFVIFRENTEGLYTGAGRVEAEGEPGERAVSEAIATRRGVERIVRAAFEFARAEDRSRVTLGDKANAVPHVYGLWRRVFTEVAGEYPAIQSDMQYVDALAMQLVRAPDSFEVIVTSNLLGDILSDLSAELVGGMGLAPSANVNPGRHALYEPVHGSAPDIAGTGTANPMAAILSAALLLRDGGAVEAADRVESSVDAALREGMRTPDVGGSRSTVEVGTWIAERVENGGRL